MVTLACPAQCAEDPASGQASSQALLQHIKEKQQKQEEKAISQDSKREDEMCRREAGISKDFSAGASAILETQKRRWSVQMGRVTQKVVRSVGIL